MGSNHLNGLALLNIHGDWRYINVNPEEVLDLLFYKEHFRRLQVCLQ